MHEIFKRSAIAIALFAVCVAPQINHGTAGSDDEKKLDERVSALESDVIQLRERLVASQIESQLTGHYWVERSRVLAGVKEEQTEEVAWRLATDVSCDRYILGPEVSSYHYGPLTIDPNHDPAWIDFSLKRFGQVHKIPGLIETSYGRCKIVLPGKLFEGETFLAPDRPESFESTADNGYDVYTLVRQRYAMTGVWE